MQYGPHLPGKKSFISIHFLLLEFRRHLRYCIYLIRHKCICKTSDGHVRFNWICGQMPLLHWTIYTYYHFYVIPLSIWNSWIYFEWLLLKYFMWQIGLLSDINLHEHPNLAALLLEGESLDDFMKLTPEQILIRWVNYHLARSNCGRQIENFTGMSPIDWKNLPPWPHFLSMQNDYMSC